MTFPQYAVSSWIGHSTTVSGKHYCNSVPDELFKKAAQKAAQSVQEITSQASATAGNENKRDDEKESGSPRKQAVCVGLREDAELCQPANSSGGKGHLGDLNPRPMLYESIALPLS